MLQTLRGEGTPRDRKQPTRVCQTKEVAHYEAHILVGCGGVRRPRGKRVNHEQRGGERTRSLCSVRVGRDPSDARGAQHRMGRTIRMDDDDRAFALCVHT
jgi:hypothetical protein